jgi:thioredoxin reductase (NADPH)
MRILTDTEVAAFEGETHVETVKARNEGTGETFELKPQAVFVFIGLTPNTGFLNGAVKLDSYGFIETIPTFETSMPGVFAAGDVRAGSTKQLASAIGEGVTALLMVRQYLRTLGEVPGHNAAFA